MAGDFTTCKRYTSRQCHIYVNCLYIHRLLFFLIHANQYEYENILFCAQIFYTKYASIKFVSDLRQVGGFLRVLPFLPPIKLTATIYNWNIVESGVKHHKPKPCIKNSSCNIQYISKIIVWTYIYRFRYLFIAFFI